MPNDQTYDPRTTESLDGIIQTWRRWEGETSFTQFSISRLMKTQSFYSMI